MWTYFHQVDPSHLCMATENGGFGGPPALGTGNGQASKLYVCILKSLIYFHRILTFICTLEVYSHERLVTGNTTRLVTGNTSRGSESGVQSLLDRLKAPQRSCLCFQSLNHSLVYYHSRTGSNVRFIVQDSLTRAWTRSSIASWSTTGTRVPHVQK